jgi:hypothetical protein
MLPISWPLIYRVTCGNHHRSQWAHTAAEVLQHNCCFRHHECPQHQLDSSPQRAPGPCATITNLHTADQTHRSPVAAPVKDSLESTMVCHTTAHTAVHNSCSRNPTPAQPVFCSMRCRHTITLHDSDLDTKEAGHALTSIGRNPPQLPLAAQKQ